MNYLERARREAATRGCVKAGIKSDPGAASRVVDPLKQWARALLKNSGLFVA